jgi:hypothetical protein
MELINSFVLGIVNLVAKHKERLLDKFNADFLQQVCDQHKDRISTAVEESPLEKKRLEVCVEPGNFLNE